MATRWYVWSDSDANLRPLPNERLTAAVKGVIEAARALQADVKYLTAEECASRHNMLPGKGNALATALGALTEIEKLD